MRIKRLDLKAFGPFTDQSIEFNLDGPGLHIIYGANEAGKSSSLRALHALLYGFPARTRDNFLHPNAKLFVGGCLQKEDGSEISFLRRKRNKADLLDENGEVLDFTRLQPFLHGVSPALFQSLYGIDYEGLVRGGEDILDRKGEVGESIFSAGTGLVTLRDTIVSMNAEAEKLFKAQGSAPAINKAINEFDELKKEIKDISISSRTWEEHKSNLDEAVAQLAEVESLGIRHDTKRRSLERLLRIKPQFGLRDKIEQEIRELGSVVILPDDFAGQRRNVEKDLHAARQKRDNAEERLKILQDKLADVFVNRLVLDLAEMIESLFQRSGEYKKGMSDHPRLDGMRINLRREAAALLKQSACPYPLEDIELLRPVLAKRKLLAGLAAKLDAIRQKIADAAEQRNDAVRSLETISKSLSFQPPVKDYAPLETAVRLARKLGDIDQLVEQKKCALQTRQHQFDKDLQQLGLWQGDRKQLDEVAFPLVATVERFARQFDELHEELRAVRRDADKMEEALQETFFAVSRIERDGQVPTEDDLARIRSKRDQGWRLLRRKWLQGEDISRESRAFAGDADLVHVFERNIDKADQTADRLRREADTVHRYISLQAQKELQEKNLEKLSGLKKDVLGHLDSLQQHWQQEWREAGVQVLTPKEMLSWLVRLEKIRFAAADIGTLENEIQFISRSRESKRIVLLQELAKIAEHRFSSAELEPVLVQAESVLDKGRKAASILEKLQEKGKLAEAHFDAFDNKYLQAQTSSEQLKEQWKGLTDTLGIAGLADEEAGDFFDTLRLCFDKVNEAEVLQKRIDGILLDQKMFQHDVRELAYRLLPDRQEEDPVPIVLHLRSLLKEAGENSALEKQYARQIAKEKEDAENAVKSLQACREELAVLCSRAGCHGQQELDRAERLSQQMQSLQEKMAGVNETLAQMSDGVSLVELEDQARGVNTDELPGIIAALSREIREELDPEIKRFSEIIGKEKKNLEMMDGNDAAARKAEAAASKLAEIGSMAHTYVRLKVAARILADEIERYREKNQDPVLRIASDYFGRLTLGSFSGLRTDEDDRSRPILVGSRHDGSRVEVGRMSSGTRDQLFLALRLASLQWRHRTTEPMPFIVDDILINFDDERTRVTLEIMAELAVRTQVILFTHHNQVRRSALALDGRTVHVHDLVVEIAG